MTALIVAGVALLAAVTTTAILLLPNRSVRVPSLVGVSRTDAELRAGALGLTLKVRATRFDPTVPKDAIAAQEPTAGVLVAPGSVLIVDVSAGSESFALPDVVGQEFETARNSLRARGLTVIFVTAVSAEDSGTVIASMPASGTSVSTGDTVRLTVAATVGTIPPTDLTGRAFVLDPEPAGPTDPTDVGMEVATRLSALLTAAGAQVTFTRTSTVASAGAGVADRVRIAKETSATALVGLSVSPSSLEGMVLLSMPSDGTTAQKAALSGPLDDALFATLRTDFSTISTLTAPGDAVLLGSNLPGVRLRLGSYASTADAASFRDEHWIELVANDIYHALAQLYGRQ